MECRDDRNKATASSGNQGTKCNTTTSTAIDDSSRGMPPYSKQETSTAWTMEWCDRTGTALSGNQGSKCTCFHYGDSSCGMPPTSPPTWNNAPISWEARSYHTQVTIPNYFQPIETKRSQNPLEICDSSSAHHDMDVWQHGSYGASTSASAEDGNLVRSFGDKSFHYLDNAQPLSSWEQNMNCISKGGPTKSFDPRTFGH